MRLSETSISLRSLLVCFCTMFASMDLYAQPAILDAWRNYYPESQSSEIECQLCHQQAVVGGDGWNSYGWLVREWYLQFNRTLIELAFEQAEPTNSDQDEQGLSNVEEIRRSLYPGWVNTNTNMIIFKDGSFLTNQPSPVFEVELGIEEPEEDFCFSVKTLNEKYALICL